MRGYFSNGFSRSYNRLCLNIVLSTHHRGRYTSIQADKNSQRPIFAPHTDRLHTLTIMPPPKLMEEMEKEIREELKKAEAEATNQQKKGSLQQD
jgi:hypothetical protein